MTSFKILIVDDFEPFRLLLCSTFRERAEFQVIDQASDGLEALQKAEQWQPDLILLDIGLPKLSGIEVAKRMPNFAPRAKILFVSQEPSSDVVREALSTGALGYLFKSRAGSELLPAIQAVLGGTQYVSGGIAYEAPLARKRAYTFDFDSMNRILRFRLYGRITDELMRDFYYGMHRPASRTQPNAGVLDASTVGSFEVSSRAMRELAAASPIMPNPDFPRVVIAPSPNVYGMMRMFAIEGELTRRNLHVVQTEHEAWAILGVQDPRFEPVDTE